MKPARCPLSKFFLFCLCLCVFMLAGTLTVFSYPLEFTDSNSSLIKIIEKPVRVVSLVPGVSEIIFALGADDMLKGTTYHMVYTEGASAKEIMGGFFSPSLKKIEDIKPNVIFYSNIQKKVKKRFCGKKCLMINIETRSLSDSYKNIILLGRIFDKEKKAEQLVKDIKYQLGIIDKKISGIPTEKRKRVIRLMGRNVLMTPGNNNFQNEVIRAAGGISPDFGKKGSIVVVTKKDWVKFNPEIIYGCGGDRETAEKFFNMPGWKDVDAVKNGKIFYFPCDLTCRASTNTGYFVSWLAARIYTDEFSIEKNLVLEEKILGSHSLDIDLKYIKNTCITNSHIYDFINKTLIIDFKYPMPVMSSLEGYREKIKSIGNHYSPPPCWGISHNHGLKNIKSKIYKVIGKDEDNASFLFTGADMKHLSVQKQVFRDMTVYALITAGVKSNAIRMSKDTGSYYEPGTINIIILTNTRLSKRAMARAIISATEAKTAALTDMDIRSSCNPIKYKATGTGTDNIIIAQGTGVEINNAGGHSKMGELIAKAVYAGVKDAVCKQNGITQNRNIFQRLDERRIRVFGLISEIGCDCNINKSRMGAMVEDILLDPVYAGFVESALVLSDDYEKGLIKNISLFNQWCESVARDIAGKKFKDMKTFIETDEIPVVLKITLNAILNGAYYRIDN